MCSCSFDFYGALDFIGQLRQVFGQPGVKFAFARLDGEVSNQGGLRSLRAEFSRLACMSFIVGLHFERAKLPK